MHEIRFSNLRRIKATLLSCPVCEAWRLYIRRIRLSIIVMQLKFRLKLRVFIK